MIEQIDFPDRWETRELGEVTSVISGYTFSSDNFQDEGVPLLKIENVSNDYFQFDDYLPESIFENTKEKYKLNGNEVLVALSGATTGATTRYQLDEPALLNQRVASIYADGENINNNYLYRLLKSPLFTEKVESWKRGGGQANIRLGDIRGLNIPVPPLDEQERIVEAVEERLERVERLEKSVENVGRLADEYQDSLLSYLLTGRDVRNKEISEDEEWFGQIPDDWDVKKLSDIGSRVSSMTEPKSGVKYSLYSFDSVDDGSGYYEVDGENVGSRKRELNGGEVMISRLNPRINRVQIVDEEHKYPPIASSEFVAIDIKDTVNRQYLYEYLRNPILQERLTNNVTGATGSRTRVGFDFVMESRIPVPPKEKQEEIVSNLRSIDFSLLQKSRSDISSLFSEYRDSVLSHAFQGDIEY